MFTKKALINITIYFSLALLGLYMSAFQRSLEDIREYYKITGILAGLMVTSHFIGIFSMPLIAGEIADRYGRRFVAAGGFFLFFIGLTLSVMSKNIILSIATFFLIGGGFGIIEGMMTTLLVDLNSGKENLVINFSQAFFCMGALIGPLMVSFFISLGYTWRSIYVIFAFFSLLYMLYMLYILKSPFLNSKVNGEKIEGTIVLYLMKKPIFLLLAISMLMYVGIEQGVAFWITSYINTMTNSIYVPSIILSSFWGFMIFGRIFFGMIGDRYNNVKIIIGLTVFSIAALLLVMVGRGFVFSGIGFALLGVGFSAIWPLIMALANKFYPKYTSTSFGVIMAFGAMGGMLIPFMAGYVGDLYSIKTGIATFFIPLLVIVVLQYSIHRQTSV